MAAAPAVEAAAALIHMVFVYEGNAGQPQQRQ
jgi:hypothetical protein